MSSSSDYQINFKSIIGRKLILYIFLFSSFITLLATGMQLYLDYRRDVVMIEDRMKQIEQSYLESITRNLWDTDFHLLKIQLEGIMRLPDIQYLEIKQNEDRIIVLGAPKFDKTIQHQFPLVYKQKNIKNALGILYVVASLDGVYQRLIDKIIVILITQAIKTFIVSIFIMFLFYFLVGRHLNTIAFYTRYLDINSIGIGAPLILHRRLQKKTDEDELDQLVFSINEMRRNLKSMYQSLEKNIEELKQNIAERKQTEKALRESENNLRAIMNIPSCAITLHDRSGIVIDGNPTLAKRLRKDINEIIGQSIWDLLPSPASEYRKAKAEEVFRTRNPVRFEDERAGLWHDHILTPIMDETGEVVKIAALSSDITERKRAEEEIRKLNEELEKRVQERTAELLSANVNLQKAKEDAEASNTAKSEFLAKMSHELRTPLNIILGFTQLMERDPSITSGQKDMIRTINRSGEHLLGLINEILEMSKIEAGRITLDKKSFDLYHTLKVIEDMIRVRIAIKGLQFILNISSDSPRYIRTDEHKLREVLMNLLENALKFTENGKITLTVSPCNIHPEMCILFEIEDTGAGIAAHEIDHLFRAFSQTECGRKTDGGTGLGLAISRKLAQLMGGDIVVKSKVGEGSVFSFTILYEPAFTAEIIHQIGARKVLGLKSNQPNYRILVVEDHTDNRILLCKILRSVGFEVKEAINGQEAIDIHQEWLPHLIWMDMRMPVIDGYEATRKIKATLKGQATAIIAITASAFEEDREAVLSAGCDDFVRKPIHESDIFNMIEKHLGIGYIYDDTTFSTPSDSDIIQAANPSNPIAPYSQTSDTISGLPENLLENLKQTIIELDVDKIQTVIDQIRPLNSNIAGWLENMVKNFEYERMLTLIGR